jgi:hypothetical protein
MDIQTRHAPTDRNWAGIMEAFSILEKYDEGVFGTGGDHDKMYVYLNPAEVSEADTARLSDLGWIPQGRDGFLKYVSG